MPHSFWEGSTFFRIGISVRAVPEVEGESSHTVAGSPGEGVSQLDVEAAGCSVTSHGLKSYLLYANLLRGHNPATLKPVVIFFV